MRFSLAALTLISIPLASALVVRQDTPPACFNNCFAVAPYNAPECTDKSDVACLCRSTSAQAAVTGCLNDQCPMELARAQGFVAAYCASQGGPTTAVPQITSSAASALTESVTVSATTTATATTSVETTVTSFSSVDPASAAAESSASSLSSVLGSASSSAASVTSQVVASASSASESLAASASSVAASASSAAANGLSSAMSDASSRVQSATSAVAAATSTGAGSMLLPSTGLMAGLLAFIAAL